MFSNSIKETVLVMGLGVTGQSVMGFLKERNWEAIGFEEISQENWQRAKTSFEGPCCRLYFKELPPEEEKKINTVVVSPGIPLSHSLISALRARGALIWSEIELASRFIEAPFIGVTGTNGKSTTVSLIHHLLEEGGIRSSLKGNIGVPLLEALKEERASYYVVELSSYQLEAIEDFHPRYAVMMNVTDDHLDRYGSITSYAQAKARIGLNQGSEDFFIYNADDVLCVQMAQESRARTIGFSLTHPLAEGGYGGKVEMIIRLNGHESRYSLEDCALQGLHNQENMLASILVASLAGVNSEAIKRGLKTFKSLPHRLELVASGGGVRFFDDSKATNVGSVVMSLASFEKNIFLILGGRDKGGDYSPLKGLIRNKVKGLLVIGEAAPKILESLGSVTQTYSVATMAKAVEKAWELSQEGDVVLLSPACSSFDQYANYKERGDDFKKQAERVIQTERMK